jgi:hypothetical protein
MDLDPSWSLNRVFIAGLPELDLPDGVQGKTAYDLLAAKALSRLIREEIGALQIGRDLVDHELNVAFDACLESSILSVKTAAYRIAETFGRRLGYVLLTLKRGDRASRDARPDWSSLHWSRWAATERVWLGGGLVGGNLGSYVARHAGEVVREGGIRHFGVRTSSHGAALPLVGAARYVPPGTGSAVILDFGSTAVKRARAILKNDEITEIHRLPSRPAWRPLVDAPESAAGETAENLIHDMTKQIAETWRTAHMIDSSTAKAIPVSVAAYVKDGHPLTGAYGTASHITGSLEAELGLRVSTELGTSIRIRLLHDGTAAAAAYAGQENAAVIMMGTALGVGFPGDGRKLRRIRDALG